MLSSLRFLLLFWVAALSTAASDYYERLHLQPLPLGSLLASFHFRSNETLASYQDQIFRYFPRSLGQVLQHASTKELHLRFTTGRWDTETWGARPWDGTKEGGTGVELWAWIEAASEDEAFQKWITLNQGLSGLFCASLNFVDGTRTTRPALTFGQVGSHSTVGKGLHLLHGVLPGEVVCTENLTPFLKLLPCKGKAGISSLLDGHKVFDASWQAMSIDVQPICLDSESCHVKLQQTIDMVLDIERSKRPRDNPIPRPVPNEELVCDQSKNYNSGDTCYPNESTDGSTWSLGQIFGRPMMGSCPLSADLGPDANSVCLEVPHKRNVAIEATGTEIKSGPGHAESRCYHLTPGFEFDLQLPQQHLEKQVVLDEELVHVERTMTGHGAADGGMRTVFRNPSTIDPVSFVYFESLPWFIRPYMHTLTTEVTESDVSYEWRILDDIYYKPAIDRQRGSQLELVVSMPPASTVMLTYDFEKAILRYTEYPPDANRGFNVAPAVLRVLNQTTNEGLPKDVYIRTTSLLLPLPTPDFSMPYNVIVLTSTVMALAFGSIFNLLVRRFVGADEAGASTITTILALLRGRLLLLRDRIVGKGQKTE